MNWTNKKLCQDNCKTKLKWHSKWNEGRKIHKCYWRWCPLKSILITGFGHGILVHVCYNIFIAGNLFVTIKPSSFLIRWWGLVAQLWISAYCCVTHIFVVRVYDDNIRWKSDTSRLRISYRILWITCLLGCWCFWKYSFQIWRVEFEILHLIQVTEH